jgi:hypothetical protein
MKLRKPRFFIKILTGGPALVVLHAVKILANPLVANAKACMKQMSSPLDPVVPSQTMGQFKK